MKYLKPVWDKLYARLQSSLRFRILFTWIVTLLLASLFFWIVADGWSHAPVTTQSVNPNALTSEVYPGQSIRQVISSGKMENLQTVTVNANVWGASPNSCLTARIIESDGNVLGEAQQQIWGLSGDCVFVFNFGEVHSPKGKDLVLELSSNTDGYALWYGNTRSATRINIEVETEDLIIDGVEMNGELVMVCSGYNESPAAMFIWPLALLAAILITLLLLRTENARKKHLPFIVLTIEELYHRYTYLLKQLVSRDFKVKYKSSVLGVFWSFLNPMLMTVVYYFVFNTLFHSTIDNFVVYLMCGIILFNYFTDATNLGLMSIVGNASLITKVYMPKYIYPFSKVLSASINMFTSMVPLLIVMLLTGVRFTRTLLLIPMVLALLICFALGISLILSSLMVFFHDVQFLWSIVTMMWNFLTPIFYPESIIPARFLFLYRLNPLYQYITFMRSIVMQGTVPSPASFVYCIVASALAVIAGLAIFRKLQDQFALYL